MVADELQTGNFGVPDEELPEVMTAIVRFFRKEEQSSPASKVGQTPQLVFFPPSYAHSIAELIGKFRSGHLEAYQHFIGLKKPRNESEEWQLFGREAEEASKSLTVDIALFGRMTTSDLVVNVEASSQVAHAISTHEVLIESDYFTAMDDKKKEYASTQTEASGAAYLGAGDTETFFNSAVYYKYLNLDVDAIRKHLPSLDPQGAAHIAGVFVGAAVLSHPTGKQNSFANPAFPELVLVEISETKRPISYANAFLQPVQGGINRNLMTESTAAFNWYIDEVARAFAPSGVGRVLLAIGAASTPPQIEHQRVRSIDELTKSVEQMCIPQGTGGNS
jgi:CRISPR-associated protein Cas7/Cse4/CasC subtype I-E